jgi:DNA-directed RNA polymerase subunit RPC12/RpoP
MKKCERCGKEHDGSYGSGRFCCLSCANKRVITDNVKKKISESVEVYYKNNPKPKHQYVCENCGKHFEQKIKIRNGKKIHCLECRRNVPHKKLNVKSIKELSKRTISKILKRANKGCCICGWNDAVCDIHHVLEKSNGGNDEMDNLVILCPNHHRIIHSNGLIKIDLLEYTLDKSFKDWKNYYAISNC